jgi:hypothetical protein
MDGFSISNTFYDTEKADTKFIGLAKNMNTGYGERGAE